MNPARYQEFTDHLISWAERTDDVIGLVAVGSMAGGARRPDEWSDHDFWIVVTSGAAALRADQSWLPEAGRILLAYRETQHGTNVVYDDGHLIEYAVFEDAELEIASANSYGVLVDKADIEPRIRAIVSSTTERQHVDDLATVFGRFVGQLVIGVTRFGRGEDLSAESMVKKWALEHLLVLLAGAVEPETTVSLDNLDPRRRFEQAYPSLGRALLDASSSPVPAAARTMVAVAENHLGAVPGNSAALRSTLGGLIDRAEAARTGR